MTIALLTLWLALAAAAPLDEARELYAAAAFDEALAVLDRVDPDSLTAADRATLHQYRAACLLALGEADRADLAMEAMVRTAPDAQPDTLDGSPRLRDRYRAVRARVLPLVVRQMYDDARAAVERRDAEAVPRLTRVRRLLDDPTVQAGASAEVFADLRRVVDGFLELSARPAATPAAAPAPARTAAPVIYTAADTSVTPPVTIAQQLPPVTSYAARVLRASEGLLEITITPEGSVAAAVMRQSLHPEYDAVLVRTARQWRYQPARRAGVAVPFVKTIKVNFAPMP